MSGFDLFLQNMGISKNAKSDFKINTGFEKPIWIDPKVKEVEILFGQTTEYIIKVGE